MGRQLQQFLSVTHSPPSISFIMMMLAEMQFLLSWKATVCQHQRWMTRQEPSVTKLTLLFKKLERTKQLSDKGLPMEFVESTATYSQDDGLGVYRSHELFYESKIVTSNMFVSSKSNSKQYI